MDIIFGLFYNNLYFSSCQGKVGVIGFVMLMDITVVQKNIIKIKGKHSSLIVGGVDNEPLKTKTQGDAMLFLKKDTNFEDSKIEGCRLIIKGPGEYEISGVKISVILAEENLVYDLEIDGLNIFLGTINGVKKIKDKLKEEKVAILYADSESDSSIITALTPRIAIFYGEKAADMIKTLGKAANPVSKYSTTLEKLPGEMEVVHLDS